MGKELVKVEERNGIPTVNARDLWEGLESQRQFGNWIQSRLQDFEVGKDYLTEVLESTGGRPATEYYLTLDTAKHVAMLERNDKGKELRQYFIDVENRAKELMNPTLLGLPDFNNPIESARAWADAIEAKELVEQKLIAIQPKLEEHEALLASEGSMTITNAAKHFGLNPKIEVFAFLRKKGYLCGHDLPTQKAIDDDVLILRENIDALGVAHKQARVPVSSLPIWHRRLVPRIKAWVGMYSIEE